MKRAFCIYQSKVTEWKKKSGAFHSLVSGNATLFEMLVFLSWLGLYLIPLFSNVVSINLNSEQKSKETEPAVSPAEA